MVDPDSDPAGACTQRAAHARPDRGAPAQKIPAGLARHAAKRSAYYREIIERHAIDLDRCVPQDFPVLTKTEAMADFDRIVTDPTITGCL